MFKTLKFLSNKDDYETRLLTKRIQYQLDLIDSKREEILKDSPCYNCRFINGEIINDRVYFICDIKEKAFDIQHVTPNTCDYKEENKCERR